MVITASINDDEATVSAAPKRPKWSDVYDGYPKSASGLSDQPAREVFIYLLGEDYYEKNKSIFTDACAARISIALLKAGVNLKGQFNVLSGDLKGKQFITSSIEMRKWLTENWGEPEEEIKDPEGLSDVQSVIKDKKGIYAMVPRAGEFSRAVGHMTLWTGNGVIGSDYADSARCVYFWELK